MNSKGRTQRNKEEEVAGENTGRNGKRKSKAPCPRHLD